MQWPDPAPEPSDKRRGFCTALSKGAKPLSAVRIINCLGAGSHGPMRSMPTQSHAPLPLENVQDYPRPPRLEPVPQHLHILLGDHVVARTNAAMRVLETHHAPTYYFPLADVQADLEPASGRTFCEWKGVAEYYSVRAGDRVAEAAAWGYSTPSPPFAELKDHIAFYATKMTACFVGDQRVLPQPGDFYGGWVTPNLQGQIKGAPGTRHW